MPTVGAEDGRGRPHPLGPEVKVWTIPTTTPPSRIEMIVSVEGIQAVVGGYFECMTLRGSTWTRRRPAMLISYECVMHMNEDALRLDLPLNIQASRAAGRDIFGPVLLMRYDGDGEAVNIARRIEVGGLMLVEKRT